MQQYNLILILAVCVLEPVQAKRSLDMQQVIRLAQENSIQAMTDRNVFAASYWNWRSYRASLLPSVSLSIGLGNFNRSLVQLQDYSTGRIGYRANYTLSNDITLYLSQSIPWTGGTVSLSTSLSRLDQYSPERMVTYYAQPVYLSYMQSISGFNSYKWDGLIEPKELEAAGREYIEAMEEVSRTAVSYYWNCAIEHESCRRLQKSFDESRRLYQLSLRRFETGGISRSELLQAELEMLDDSLAINMSKVSLQSAMDRLCSFIGFEPGTALELEVDCDSIPNIVLDYADVLDRALANSSFRLNQELEDLQARRNVAQAKAQRGVQASLNARFGMSGTGSAMGTALASLQDQEIVGISLSVPILDWGLAQGRVRMAMAQALTTRGRIEQNMADFRQDLLSKVMQFNSQYGQCRLSLKAAGLADDSYRLALESYGKAAMSMTQIEQLKEKRDAAMSTYMSNVASYWSQYFALRGATLYDYLTGTDISAELDRLTNP